jgi:DNA-binding NtrC family response regulator
MVARCLHDLSGARQENYVALNCGGMADTCSTANSSATNPGAFTGAQKRRIGKIEYASGGTLFLDEVESMPMAMQIKLLRVLQERVIERLGSNQQIPVSCRVVAASKEDLKLLVRSGQVPRRPLLPPQRRAHRTAALRERREDIPALYDEFLLQAAKRYNRPPPPLTSEHLRRLMALDWPGNIRELRNAADCHALGIGRDARPSVGNDPQVADRSRRQLRTPADRQRIHQAGRQHRAHQRGAESGAHDAARQAEEIRFLAVI